MVQSVALATTGFLSFTIPYLESSKGCGTRGHLTLGLVAIYSKVKGKQVLCVRNLGTLSESATENELPELPLPSLKKARSKKRRGSTAKDMGLVLKMI